jgi:hypothetical protein
VRRQTDGVLERPSGDAVLDANVSSVGHEAMLPVANLYPSDPRAGAVAVGRKDSMRLLVDDEQCSSLPSWWEAVNGLPDGVRVVPELFDERRFGNDVVHFRYRTRA